MNFRTTWLTQYAIGSSLCPPVGLPNTSRLLIQSSLAVVAVDTDEESLLRRVDEQAF